MCLKNEKYHLESFKSIALKHKIKNKELIKIKLQNGGYLFWTTYNIESDL